MISLGGTYEPIDSVRGITNKSSGKMGLALAKEAYIRGADLTLVVANVSVEIPSVFDVIYVDPPYYSGVYEEVFNSISTVGIVVAEHSDPLNVTNFELIKEKNYGGKRVSFYK